MVQSFVTSTRIPGNHGAFRNKGVRHCVGIVNKFPERCGKAAFFQNRALIS